MLGTTESGPSKSICSLWKLTNATVFAVARVDAITRKTKIGKRTIAEKKLAGLDANKVVTIFARSIKYALTKCVCVCVQKE